MISEHVLRMHRYLQPGVEEGAPAVDVLEQNLTVGADAAETSAARQQTEVFEKYNVLLHGGVTTSSGRGANKKKEVLSIAFIKKYIQYAKNRCKPVLTRNAADYIVSVYTSLRNDDLASNQKRVSSVVNHTVEGELTNRVMDSADITSDCPYAGNSNSSVNCARKGALIYVC